MKKIQQVLNKINANPKLIFLIDGSGAVLSAFLLGVVLVYFQELIGLPTQTLYVLSSIAILFAIYSFFCSMRIRNNWRTFLKVIAVANLSYCVLTLGMLFYHRVELTKLGVIYFLLEMMVVIPLAIFELRVASNIKTV